MAFDVAAQETPNGWPVLRLSGRFDFNATDCFRSQIAELQSAGHKHVVVDLTSIDYIDRPALGSLINIQRLGNVNLTLICREEMRKSIRSTMKERVFPICNRLESADISIALQTRERQPVARRGTPVEKRMIVMPFSSTADT